MDANQPKNENLQYLVEIDKLIKDDKILNGEENNINTKTHSKLLEKYDKVCLDTNLSNDNLKNISILCDRDGNVINNRTDFAVNLVRISVKEHMKRYENVKKNEDIIKRVIKNTIKTLFNEDEIKSLNEITNNSFVDRCLESISYSWELPEELKEMQQEKINGMVQVYRNNFARVPIDNDFKLFNILWENCSKSKKYIEYNKNNPEFKKSMPSLYKQDGTLINLDKKYDLAMNFFRQFVMAQKQHWESITHSSLLKRSIIRAIDIRELFTEKQLIELGGNDFIRDCYDNAYKNISFCYTPTEYLKLEKEDSYSENILAQIYNFSVVAAFFIMLYLVSSLFFPVLSPALTYVATVLGISAGIGGIGYGSYVASQNRSYKGSLSIANYNIIELK